MAGTTTVYDVKVQYLVNDKASAGMAAMGATAAKAQRSTAGLAGSLRNLMMLGGGFMIFTEGKKALIDYNAQLEQARIQMAGMIQMNVGGEWATQMGQANKLVNQFREDAKKSTATTMDFVNMAALINGPLLRAGGSIKEIRDVTKGAVIASRAFGINTEFAALDIQAALTGTLRMRDRFARALLEPMGMTTDKWNDMVKKNRSAAVKMLTDAFNQKAVQNMARTQEKSWLGISSTLKDNLERAFAKMGKPMMDKIHRKMMGMIDFFETQPKRVAQFVEQIGNTLVTAFDAVKGAIMWIVDNKALLLGLTKAFLVHKGIGMIGGMAQGAWGWGAGLVDMFRKPAEASKTFTGFLGGAVKKLGAYTIGLGLAIGAMKIFQGYMEDRQEQQIVESSDRAANMGGRYMRMLFEGEQDAGLAAHVRRKTLQGGFGDIDQYMARRIVQHATQMGVAMGGQLTGNRKQIADAFGMKERTERWTAITHLMKALEIDRYNKMAWEDKFLVAFKQQFDLLAKKNKWSYIEAWREIGNTALAQLFPSLGKTTQKHEQTNITIKRVEVQSEDPDRFAFAAIGAFQDIARNRTQARRARREGGR